jgi:wyosine [tRNA(Phe)-imidazoG37] synthetase (radical SAM superfamily)
MDIAFGPVPSRRLGRSLGINNIPPKHCGYACVYCQAGPTAAREVAPGAFYPAREIRRQVSRLLEAVGARGEGVDYLSFVPDGEPTLDSGLGEAIDSLRDLGLPIAVISNASLIWRGEVRAALARADWVSLRLDSVDADAWRRVNRPHPNLELARILDGIRVFAREFPGALACETMLIQGVNDGEAAIAALGGFLREAGIRRAWLAIPHRPPGVAGARGPDEAVIVRAHQALAALGIDVGLLTGHEGEDFAYGGKLRRDLLAITAVHPLRESAVRVLVDKARADMGVVARLLDSGELRRVVHEGEAFYLRRPRAEQAHG